MDLDIYSEMAHRVDSASRLISAPATTLYSAFASPGAMERWLPPTGMTGEMLSFDFRDGGSYRMRLTYAKQQGLGKSSENSDDVEVLIVKLEAARRIEQEVTFRSEDPRFSGVMRMTWTFEPEEGATRVSVRAENVPEGIRAEDHQAGLSSTLENLADFVEERPTQPATA